MALKANPYLDDTLLRNLQSFSPNANAQFLQAHSPQDPPLEVFILSVVVISGHNLPAKDILKQSSDPYCKLVIDGTEVAQTKTIEHELNPVWNERFDFKFFSQPSSVRLEVFDFDQAMNDDRIGAAKFSFNHFFNKRAQTASGEIEPYVGEKRLKGTKASTIKFKIFGRRFRPILQQRVVDGQRLVIEEKNAEIHDRQQQHARLLTENEQLVKRKQADKDTNALKVDEAVAAKQQPQKESSVAGKQKSVCVLLRVWQFMLNLMFYRFPMMGYYNDLLVLYIGYVLRLGMFQTLQSSQRSASRYKRRPAALLKLYEMEGDVQCKQVRETLSLLSLDCIIYPSFHQKVPVLRDENCHCELTGSAEIISYLHATYGGIDGYLSAFQRVVQYVINVRVCLLLYRFLYLSILRCLPQHGRASIVSESQRGEPSNDNLLELWSMEAAPSSTKVREVLSSLQMCYILRNTVSPKEKKLPVLIDTYTETEIVGDAEKMKQYLLKTYA